VWEETTDDGMVLHACCLAGTLGEPCRRTLGPTARLLETFTAANDFEAMTRYHVILGREPYTTDHATDYDPYPEQWQR
jgi:hypothetical protein